VDPVTLEAFGDEFAKIAGLGDWWQGFLDIFRGQKAKARRRVDYHFSDKAGPDRWNKFSRNVEDPQFIRYLTNHPKSDAKVVRHAVSLHHLAKGKVLGKVQSSRLPGRSYEIRQLPKALGCTCPDWRYKGSVNPGYECKHIKAHQAGKVTA
jgi:hypothetical protein